MPSPNPFTNPPALDPFKETRPKKSITTKLKEIMLTKFLTSALSSWKTTLAGVVMLLNEINDVINGQPLHWEIIMAAIGLIFAKDGNVSNSSMPGPVAKAV
jgi:hypothetical protein